jgi:chromosome segregation ATPase
MYRVRRLDGLVRWNVEQEFDERLTRAWRNLQDLDGVIDDLKKQYRSFVRTRQAATQSYEGYTIPIQQLRTRIENAQQKLKSIMARQGRIIETLAIEELDKRRQRLEDYQIKARFALAESYDRATKAQEKKLLEQQPASGPAIIDQPEDETPATPAAPPAAEPAAPAPGAAQ